MRKILSILVILLLFIGVSSYGQTQYSIKRATNEVLNEGILQHNPDMEFVFFTDFFGVDSVDSIPSINQRSGWTFRKSGTKPTTFNVIDSVGGILKVVTAATENDGFNYIWNIDLVKPSMLHDTLGWCPIEFGIRAAFGENIQNDIFMGLVPDISDTLCNDALLTSGIYFYNPDGDSNWACITSNASVYDSASSGVALDDNDSAFVEYKFILHDTSTVDFYINDKLVVQDTTDGTKPVMGLRPAFGYEIGASLLQTIHIDYIYLKQRRVQNMNR